MPLAVDLKYKKIYNAKRVGQQQCLTLFVAFSFTRLSSVNRNLLGTDKGVNKDLFCGILYRKRLCFCWCVAAWVKQKMVL